MESTITPHTVYLHKNRWKVFIIPIILIVAVLTVGGLYLLYFSGDDFLQDYSPKFDYNELTVEPDFDNPLTGNYTSSPLSIMDLELSPSLKQVFVVDTSARRVLVYDYNFQNIRNIGEMYGRDGTLIVSGVGALERDYGDSGDYPDEVFSIPVSAAIDSEGTIVVFDRIAEEFKYFDSSFNLLRIVEMSESITSNINVPDVPNVDGSEINLEIMDNGNFLVHGRAENKILLLTADGLSLIKLIEPQGTISHVQVNGDSFYLVDVTNQAIIEYDSRGNLVGDLGLTFSDVFDLCVEGNQMIVTDKKEGLKIIDLGTKSLSETISLGSSVSPSYIVCDFTEKTAFVYDEGSAELIKVNLDDYSVVSSISSVRDLKVLSGNPGRIAINPINKDVVFSDSPASLIMVLDSELNFKKVIALGYGDSATNIKMPAGMDFDSEGNLYVLDRYNRKIRVYGSNYAFVRTIDNIRNNAAGLAVLGNGNIAYSDETSGITSIMDSLGNVIAELDTPREPKALRYYNGVLYSAEYLPGSRNIAITEYNSDYGIEKEYIIETPSEFDLGDGIGVYGNIVVIPDNFARELYFYDLSKEEVTKTISVSHLDTGLSALDIAIFPEEDYAAFVNSADGKIFKLDLEKRKLSAEELVRDYYGAF